MKKLIAIVLALAIGFAGGFIYAKQSEKNNGTYSLQVLSEEVNKISELSVVQEKYELEVPYTSETKKLWHTDIEIPFSQKSMVVDFTGTLKLGPNMEGFSQDDLAMTKDFKNLTVYIPHSEILSNEIDEDSWTLKDKKNGLFNLLKPEDDSELRKFAKSEVLKQLDVDELLAAADAEASEQIASFLQTAYPGLTVNVEFK